MDRYLDCERGFRELRDGAKRDALRCGVLFERVRKERIREGHSLLTAVGIPRRVNGNRLGLRRRMRLEREGL